MDGSIFFRMFFCKHSGCCCCFTEFHYQCMIIELNFVDDRKYLSRAFPKGGAVRHNKNNNGRSSITISHILRLHSIQRYFSGKYSCFRYTFAPKWLGEINRVVSTQATTRLNRIIYAAWKIESKQKSGHRFHDIRSTYHWRARTFNFLLFRVKTQSEWPEQ